MENVYLEETSSFILVYVLFDFIRHNEIFRKRDQNHDQKMMKFEKSENFEKFERFEIFFKSKWVKSDFQLHFELCFVQFEGLSPYEF